RRPRRRRGAPPHERQGQDPRATRGPRDRAARPPARRRCPRQRTLDLGPGRRSEGRHRVRGAVPRPARRITGVHHPRHKLASTPATVFNNAIERLLGKTTAEIEALAEETPTGNLPRVLAELTPEEVNEDRLGVARHLSEEEDLDPKELGLQLDVLKIQHVSDEVGHLPAIGEKATAE